MYRKPGPRVQMGLVEFTQLFIPHPRIKLSFLNIQYSFYQVALNHFPKI